MDFIVVTNNESVRRRYADLNLIFVDGNDRDVMTSVRDLVHKGHSLLTHPLSGSLKPGEQPFRSILVSAEAGSALDTFSLELIESCLAALKKFRIRYEGLSESKLADFREVDLSLIDSAMPKAMADRASGRFK